MPTWVHTTGNNAQEQFTKSGSRNISTDIRKQNNKMWQWNKTNQLKGSTKVLKGQECFKFKLWSFLHCGINEEGCLFVLNHSSLIGVSLPYQDVHAVGGHHNAKYCWVWPQEVHGRMWPWLADFSQLHHLLALSLYQYVVHLLS